MRLNIRNTTISEMSEQLHIEESWKENTLQLEHSSVGKEKKKQKPKKTSTQQTWEYWQSLRMNICNLESQIMIIIDTSKCWI